jgi:acid phosphatase type 7
MRSLPYGPSRAVAITLAITIVLAVGVLGFYMSRSAEANHKPGHGNGNGDTTPPETTLTAGPAEGSTTTQANASFGFSSSEAKSTFSCQLDGGGFSPCTSPKTYNSLANGSHTFEVKAQDAAGNTDATPARRTWTVNTTAQSDPVFVGAGDIASCASSGDEATAKLLDSIPGTVYNLGDNAYEDGTAAEFANCYNPSWGRHKARTKPTPGNHEYHTAGASGYFGYFGTAAGPEPQKGYYSYNLGAWHIISLNSMCENVGGCGASSPMVSWLKGDLAANPSSCTLAYWHHPVFSSGSEHGNDPKMIPSWDTLYAAGADVVLSGHDHDYERFAPQTSSGVADSARGIREFVVGTGGKSHYRFGTIRSNSQVRNSDTNGVLKLTLHPTSYEWQFVPEAGKTFSDSGSGSCH